MSLSSGTYRIYSQSHNVQVGSFLGSSGTNPLYIYAQTTPGLPAFSLTSLSNGKYQIKLAGAAVRSSNGFLVADKSAGAVATEWSLQSAPEYGSNSYVINWNNGASKWSSIAAGPTNQTSLQVYYGSPSYSAGNVFQLDKLN